MQFVRFDRDYLNYDHVIRVQHDPSKKLLFLQTVVPSVVIEIDGNKNAPKYAHVLAWLNSHAEDVTGGAANLPHEAIDRGRGKKAG